MATKKLNDHQQWILDEARRVLDGAESWAMFHGKELGRLHLKYGSGISSATLKVMGKKGVIRLVGYSGHDFELVDPEPAAAIAANGSADAAPAWTPAVGDIVRVKELDVYGTIDEVDTSADPILYSTRDANGSRIKTPHDWYFTADELEPAPDAAQTAAAGDDVDTLVREWEAAHADPRDAEIAALERELEAVKQMFDGYQAAARETEQALTRDLEAARTEAAALRTTTTALETERDLLRELILDITERVNSYSPMEGLTKVYELKNRAASIVRVNVVQLTTSELFPADAALASARQRADSGARTSADDVLALFADDDAAVLERFKFKVGDKVFIAREANTALCDGIIQQAQRDAYKCTIDRVFQSIAGVELYTVRYGNATDDFSEDELIEAQS